MSANKRLFDCRFICITLFEKIKSVCYSLGVLPIITLNLGTSHFYLFRCVPQGSKGVFWIRLWGGVHWCWWGAAWPAGQCRFLLSDWCVLPPQGQRLLQCVTSQWWRECFFLHIGECTIMFFIFYPFVHLDAKTVRLFCDANSEQTV